MTFYHFKFNLTDRLLCTFSCISERSRDEVIDIAKNYVEKELNIKNYSKLQIVNEAPYRDAAIFNMHTGYEG